MDGDVLSGSAREGGRLESDCSDGGCDCCCGSEYGARIANSKSAHVFQMRQRMDRRERPRAGRRNRRATDEGNGEKEGERERNEFAAGCCC